MQQLNTSQPAAVRSDTPGNQADPLSIETELNRILGSKTFARSPRLRRMLEYVVRRFLDGNANILNGYALGIDVFDRDLSFEPALDPIVRVQAARLRRLLERYYAQEGPYDSLRIDIPKGTYAPNISHPLSQSGISDQNENLRGITVIALPFIVVDEIDDKSSLRAAAMHDYLICLLDHAGEICITSFPPVYGPHKMPARGYAAREGGRFILKGTIIRFVQDYLFIVSLSEETGGNVIGSWQYNIAHALLITHAEAVATDLLKHLAGYVKNSQRENSDRLMA
jgi:hypothetical protein